ncbi:MAG: helix-hairpin-helix domain-containing protein [Desulfuromonadales bacterium]|nr:helix-hairpin-helix domain-containing protein [Desulfuromonadales bacterium]
MYPTADSGVRIGQGAGFSTPGVYQFSDGSGLQGVISMTGTKSNDEALLAEDCPPHLIDGLLLTFEEKTALVQCGWMPAEHRIALGIALHPDRMSEADWQALPGIGPVLAERIELDRQNNGDFGRLESLRRVKGVGPKRIETWRTFF